MITHGKNWITKYLGGTMKFVQAILLMGVVLLLLVGSSIADGRTFSGNLTLHIDDYIEAISMGDLQGDGGTDMAIIAEEDRIYISCSRHDGTYAEPWELYYADTMINTYDIKMADINNDGLGDIIFTCCCFYTYIC